MRAKEAAFLKPYQAIVVQCSISDELGNEVYASEREIVQRAVLQLANGTEVKPLTKYPPQVKATIEVMKAFMAEDGDGMYILVFPASTSGGKKIVDTTKKDKLTMVLKASKDFPQAVFTWRTPFDTLQGDQTCATCKEDVSVKWSYCPWCGAKL